MSLAINRDEMNEFLFAGTGTPSQLTVDYRASYFKDEWLTAYASYEPDQANTLLDQMGLKKDSDGWRLRSDGDELIITLPVTQGSAAAGELIKDYWEAVGVQVKLDSIDGQLYNQRMNANELDVVGGEGNRLMEMRAYNIQNTPFNLAGDISFAIEWNNWFNHQNWVTAGSQGEEPEPGVEPPQYVKDYIALVSRWQSAGTEAEYERLAQQVFDFHAENTWLIGTVARPLWPVIVKNRVQNVPEEKLPFSDDTSWWLAAKPIQWFVEE
jgi:peptide/nickel transport system substrate-binding protein